MWKQDLMSQGYQVVCINAWETDFDDEPLIPIASALLDNIKPGEGAAKTKSALKGALGAAALIGNKFLEQATGINAYETMKEAESNLKADDLQKIGEELYKEFSFKKKAYEELKIKLADYINKLPMRPLVMLIDELDRARPDYAVKLLEAIKHIFPLKGACFVLAVDRKQLEASVKQLYGNIDFENYYRRFVSREANLNEASNPKDLNKFIMHLGNKYFDEKTAQGIRFPFTGQQKNEVLGYARTIWQLFQFTPREMEALFRIYSQFLAVNKEVTNSNLYWLIASIVLIAIYIRYPDVYRKIGKNAIRSKELSDFIDGFNFSGQYAETDKEWFAELIVAFSLSSDKELNSQLVKIVDKYYKNNLRDDDNPPAEAEIIRELARRVLSSYGELQRETGFQYLYKIIEEWRSFI